MSRKRSTPEQKMASARGCAERLVVRRRLRIRENFLKEVAASVRPEILSPKDAAEILFLDLKSARQAVVKARRRAAMDRAAVQTVSSIPGELSLAPPRPEHILSRLNRAAVFPPLVVQQNRVESGCLDEIIHFLSRPDARELPAPQLLDELVAASGISWENCAELLFLKRIVTSQIDLQCIDATRRARLFWNLFATGRERYVTLASIAEIPRWNGDWAFFDRAQLEALLPNIILPRKFRREEYLANYIEAIPHGDSSLDLHLMPNGLPLFRHPFLGEFNPLSFGKRMAVFSSK